MQTVSPENILETKSTISDKEAPYITGCGEFGYSKNSCFQAQPGTSFEKSLSSESPPSVFSHMYPFPHQSSSYNEETSGNKEVSSSSNKDSMTTEVKKSNPIIRNFRINIVNPSSGFFQRKPNSAPYVIPESPFKNARNTDASYHNSGANLGSSVSATNLRLDHSNKGNEFQHSCKPDERSIQTDAFVAGSPEFRNKRKRYMPFRSPFLDVTNQEEDDNERSEPEAKKSKVDSMNIQLSMNNIVQSMKKMLLGLIKKCLKF